MVPCNSDDVVIFGCVFAWGVCALFGQVHLPDAHFRIVWCIFRRHVDFQDILPRKRGFVTKRSTKSQIAWNHDFRRGGGPGRTFQCRQRSKKNTIWLLESTRFTETLKVFDQGRFSTWKEEQERRLIWCRFSSSLHLRAKSQRAQHIICNIQTTFLNPAHRLDGRGQLVWPHGRRSLSWWWWCRNWVQRNGQTWA